MYFSKYSGNKIATFDIQSGTIQQLKYFSLECSNLLYKLTLFISKNHSEFVLLSQFDIVGIFRINGHLCVGCDDEMF